MKNKKKYLIVICLCMSLNINAQWTMLHSFRYEDVCITDNNVGYSAGRATSKGVISKTTDNGNTWLPIYFHNNDLYSLSFPNSNVGYVVGQGGSILKTTDSGGTWNSVQNPYSNQSTVKFISVHFVDENIGFVISSSGAFLKTLDGGLNWTNSSIPHNGAFPLQEFCYIDTNTYVIVGFQGKICKTIDGGLTWSEQVSNISSQINSVFFVNDSIGYCAAHYGKILKTINGGNNWTVMTLPLAVNNKDYYSIYFYNINEGIICGSDGVIISTTDGGLNWSIKQSGTTDVMLSMSCSSQNICYVVGNDGLIVKSIDNGNNWSVINEGTYRQLNSVHFPSPNIGYICGGAGVILRTTDGGYNWIKKNVVSNYNLNSVFFTDTLTGYIAGSTGGTSPISTILKTTDGGVTWSNWTGHLSGYKYDLETIYFINQSIGFAGGTIVNDNGAAYFILKTTDAGNTWQHISNINFMAKIKSFYFLDLQNGYAVGRSGRILKTVDGGVSWSLTVFPNFPNFNYVYFIDNNNGYAVGENGIFIKTNDGGLNWYIIETGTTSNLNSVYFSDNDNGYLAGNYPVSILQTQDGGYTWNSPSSNGIFGTQLISLFFTNSYEAYAVGGSGAIVKKFCPFQLPESAGAITGQSIVCQGETSAIYTVPTIANATSYVWTLPSGATGTSTTNSITVDYGTSATSGNITVKGVNSCGEGAISTLPIIVNALPLAAGSISGTETVCQGETSVSYSVPTIANATSYVWTLPSGATGTSATNSITVSFGATAASGNITVKGNNSCGDGAVSTKAITVNPLPTAAGTITGNATVCQGQNSVTYTVPIITNATSYVWTLPSGATGTSTTNSITVNYGISATSGNISVKGNNSCGDGTISTLAITVNPLPVSAGTITGSTTVCQGQNSLTYTVPTISNATSYFWTLPSGSTGTSITNSITVDFGTSAISGDITVKGINSCGYGTTTNLPITVNVKPTTPIITLNGLVLHSDASNGNQWFNQNGLINGATNQNHTVTVDGDYYVIVSLSGCSSDPSNTINVTLTGIEVVELGRVIKVYPNPVSNELIIEIEGNNEMVNFDILNAIGQIVFKGNIVEKITVQTSNFAPGVYVIKLENGKTFEFKKIIKE